MKIRLPYVFHASGKLRGSRAVTREVVGDWLELELETIDPTHAPVAARWREPETLGLADFFAVGPDRVVEVRQRDGQFYRPLTVAEKGAPQRPLRVEDLVALPPVNYRDRDPTLHTFYKAFVEGAKTLARPPFVEDLGSEQEEIIDAYRAWAEKCVFVDGAVWEKCPSPILVLEETAKERFTYWEVGAAFPDRIGTRGSWTRRFEFALDEAQSASLFAAARAEDLRIAIDLANMGSIEVLSAEHLARPEACDDIVRYAEDFLHTAGGTPMNRASVPLLESFTDFRKSFDKARLTPEDDNIHNLLDDWAHFAAVRLKELNVLEAERGLPMTQPKDDPCSNICSSLYTRFEQRSVELSQVFSEEPARQAHGV